MSEPTERDTAPSGDQDIMGLAEFLAVLEVGQSPNSPLEPAVSVVIEMMPCTGSSIRRGKDAPGGERREFEIPQRRITFLLGHRDAWRMVNDLNAILVHQATPHAPSESSGGLTDLEFADVRGRVWARKAADPRSFSPKTTQRMIEDEVALVAEIERLRRLVGEV